jgi:excisionase family DNA binding protein
MLELSSIQSARMSEYLTTKELAELLRIKERKVYDLAASGEVPCSRAMGKLLFPREAVNAWLIQRSSGLEGLTPRPLPNVFLGSHDPLLDWALRQSQCGIATYFDASLDGIARFARREGIATGLHIYDAEQDDWNTPIVRERCGTRPVVLVEWAKRRRGLILGDKLETPVTSVAALKGRRVVPRQAEAGAHSLFLHILQGAGLTADDLDLMPPARTEVDAALAVLEGKAEATFGLAVLAAQYRLPFLPVMEERFDLAVDRRAWFEPPMQRFLDFCRSEAFLARARELEGYDVSDFGTVHYNGP